MFAVFNRFDKSYEEAAQDLGASQWQTLKEVVLPIIAPSIIGINHLDLLYLMTGLPDSQVMSATNTLPLELRGLTTTVTTPIIYVNPFFFIFAILFSFLVLILSAWLL